MHTYNYIYIYEKIVKRNQQMDMYVNVIHLFDVFAKLRVYVCAHALTYAFIYTYIYIYLRLHRIIYI